MRAELVHNRTSTVAGAAFLLLGTAAFGIAWVGLNAALPELQAKAIPSIITQIVLHVLLLGGAWLAIQRTSFDGALRVRLWLAIAIPFTAWLALIWWLAVAGVFRPGSGTGVPALPLAIFLPVIALLPLLRRSQLVGAILDATPGAWLIGAQTYRVMGGIFLVAWSQGALSGAFAVPAAIGDMLVGMLALPVAYLLARRAAGATGLAIAWNVLGLIDFSVAVGMGIISAPGPMQLIVPDIPDTQLGTFPTVMIPAFIVPSSILLHVLSLRQLARQRRAATLPVSNHAVTERQP